MTGDQRVVSHIVELRRIDADAEDLIHQLTACGVMVAIQLKACTACAHRSAACRRDKQGHCRAIGCGHTDVEWLTFLKEIDHETPKEETLHLIADNDATQEHPVVKKSLAEHLHRGVLTASPELIGAIDDDIAHNNKPRPFIWTKNARSILQ